MHLILESKLDELNSLDENIYGEAIRNIIDFIEKEHALYCNGEIEFEDKGNILEQESFKLEQLVFELTQNCNLKCKYCIYNDLSDDFRNFSLKDMTFQTAKEGVDYALSHCGSELVIGFYGGEPLLNFELIKNIVQYIDAKKNNKIIRYSITTNLVLMDEEKSAFFSKLDYCTITCSIDGPEKIHNLYRMTPNEKTSFDQAIKGLHNLVNSFQDRAKDCISIYTVICPPYDDNKLNAISNFFDHLRWLPKEVNCSITKVKKGTISTFDDNTYEDVLFINDPIKEWAIKKLINSKNINDYVVKCEKANLMKIHNRYLTNLPKCNIPMNGCCIPGQRRLYLTTQGKFLLCEKMGVSPYVGDASNGLNFDVITEKYMQDYKDKSLSTCANCWAVNLCPVCYSVCYDSEGIDIKVKNSLCSSAKNFVCNNLIEYHEVLENNPTILMDILKKEY